MITFTPHFALDNRSQTYSTDSIKSRKKKSKIPLYQNYFQKKYQLQAGRFDLTLGEKTQIMGIVNITPDSFSRDGCIQNNNNFTQKAVLQARRMIREGADIIDIGGESSRPGSRPIAVQEEINRVIPAVKKLAKTLDVPISIDTYKSAVVQHALDAGAAIVNNIKGVESEKSLLKMVSRYNAAIVVMHMKGTPRTMQKQTQYRELIPEIISSLRRAVETCLNTGIKPKNIIIDPGIGFGKTVEQNLEILNRLREFDVLKQPILIGTSRKSFIGHILNKDTHERLWGTLATLAASITNGAHIVRVHDVRPAKDVVQIIDAITKGSYDFKI